MYGGHLKTPLLSEFRFGALGTPHTYKTNPVVIWAIGGHQVGGMSPRIAQYGHWVGFVCMGVPPASKMGCLGLLAWGTPSYTQNQPNGHMELDASSHHPPGAPLPPASRPLEWLWRYENRHFCVHFLVLHGVSTSRLPNVAGI